MTEAEWLACDDPVDMVIHLKERVSDRKFWLFAVTCCRRVWRFFDGKPSGEVIECVERFVDSIATKKELNGVWVRANAAYLAAREGTAEEAALGIASNLGRGAFNAAGCTSACAEIIAYPQARDEDEQFIPAVAEELAAQCGFFRDIIGPLPFRTDLSAPACRMSAVLSLAQAAYEERELPSGHLDPLRLAVLADALEEAGCTDAAILSHLRSPGPHVRGCWALDLVMGKE